MRPRISVRACVRRSVGPSVRRSLGSAFVKNARKRIFMGEIKVISWEKSCLQCRCHHYDMHSTYLGPFTMELVFETIVTPILRTCILLCAGAVQKWRQHESKWWIMKAVMVLEKQCWQWNCECQQLPQLMHRCCTQQFCSLRRHQNFMQT